MACSECIKKKDKTSVNSHPDRKMEKEWKVSKVCVKMSRDNLLRIGTMAIKQGLYYRACMPHRIGMKKFSLEGSFMPKGVIQKCLDKMEWGSKKYENLKKTAFIFLELQKAIVSLFFL